MKTIFLFPALCLLLGGMAACSSVEPDGALKEVAENDLFSGPEPPPLAPDNTRRYDKKPPLRLKIALDDH